MYRSAPVLHLSQVAVLLRTRAAVVSRVPQTLQVPLPRSPSARVSFPGAAVLVRVPQTLQVPLPRSPSARDSFPGAAVLVRVQVPLRSKRT